ncbi:MAG: nitrate reductase molybdenum cofactor assembly chaperone [Rhodospirillaceae bacterium]
MAATFKVLSLLLSYPTREIRAGAAELSSALEREGLLGRRAFPGVYELLEELAERDLYDLQERYVLLFDRTRSLSLHLFEHVHGESRDRGQAMVDLNALYGSHGLTIGARELPDFLPLFLEFLSLLEATEARRILGQPLDILKALEKRVRKRGSIYASVFRALVKLADSRPDDAEVAAMLKDPDDDPDDLAAIDRAWEEQAVRFGPGDPNDSSCPRMDKLLRRIDPAPGTAGSGDHG